MQERDLNQINYLHLITDGFILHEHLGQFTADWHQHEQGQLIYTENGLLFIYTTDSRFLLPTNFCAWIPPGKIHKLVSFSPDLFLRTLFLDIKETREDFYRKAGIYQNSALLSEMIYYSKRWNKISIGDEVSRSFYQNLKNLLPDLCKEEAALTLPAPKSAKLIKIVTFLTENVSQKHSIDNTASCFGISGRTLSRLFKAELGVPMFQFLKIVRIIKALEWFDEGVSNVTEVVYRLGYESVSTFSNNFNEVLGYRPLAYLQKKNQK